jgi:flagellar basal body-associated protein FliL
MNTKLLLVAVAAAFATASCSQEKKTETTETTAVPAGEQTTTTTTTTVDTAAYRTSADQLVDQVATDLKATDATIKARLQNAYYTRGRALRDLDTRYTADTTGRYAALKAVNDQTTSEVKTIVDPAQYKTYTTSQGTYYSGPYTATTVTTTTTAPAKASLGARVGQGSGIKKLENNDDDRKVKYENGAKIKRSDDGSLKIKRADGTKIKIDEDGHRTVKKGLF